MYKLSVEFKSVSDLQAFIGKLDTTTVSIEATAITKASEDAPKSAAKKKAPIKEVEAEVIPSTQVAAGPVNIPYEPRVQPEVSKVSTPVAPELDRAAAIVKATQLVNALKASGIGDDKIMPNIHEVYAQAGCPLNLKISQFDDVSLARFIPLFEAKVNAIVNAPRPAAPAGAAAFI